MSGFNDLLAQLHAGHDCKPAKCTCLCGCDVQMGCTAVFGPLCSVCSVRVLRDEGDGPHGYPDGEGGGDGC